MSATFEHAFIGRFRADEEEHGGGVEKETYFGSHADPIKTAKVLFKYGVLYACAPEAVEPGAVAALTVTRWCCRQR